MSSSGRELVSRRTRSEFRGVLTGCIVRDIETAFQDEDFAPDPDSTYEDTSERRVTAQRYMESVNWTDGGHVARALRVFERLLFDLEDQYTEKLCRALRSDGYVFNDSHEIVAVGPQFLESSLADLTDPAAILEHLGRIQRAINDDPAQAVGSSKELIESTAKVVLTERKLPVDDKDDVPALVKKAQQALGLHPSSSAPGPDGSDAVRRILGSVSSVAIGVAELRNRGYGTGHGPRGARVGLRARHAHLAVNAATTWCQLMLDTLADQDAPWRKSAGEAGKRGAPPSTGEAKVIETSC